MPLSALAMLVIDHATTAVSTFAYVLPTRYINSVLYKACKGGSSYIQLIVTEGDVCFKTLF